MSQPSHGARGPLAPIFRLLVLVAVFGCMWATSRLSPAYVGPATPVAALGFLLLAGQLSGELGSYLRLPHLTGYLLAGLVAGPHVLDLIGHDTVEQLQAVNGPALALVAFSAGAELTLDMLRQGLRGILLGIVTQTVCLFVVMSAVFVAARPIMPFLAHQPLQATLGLGLLWAVVAIVKSPSAVLGVMAETGSQGVLTRFAVSMVVILDIVVLVFFAVALVFARTLIEPGSAFSLAELAEVGHEIVASIALGTTIGLVVAIYLRLVAGGTILFLVAVAFGTSELAKFFGYDAMIIFAVAGFVVQNLSHQGPRLLRAIDQSGSVLFVIFFANAGAHLDLATLRMLWPVALLFAGARAVATAGAAIIGTRLANDPPQLRRYGWFPLISQAGIAIGVAVATENAFPAVGSGFRSLAVAVVAINEAVGPILTKLAFERTGETRRAREAAGLVEEARG
jgi:Kef-type K+ transport system membrane component KefB